MSIYHINVDSNNIVVAVVAHIVLSRSVATVLFVIRNSNPSNSGAIEIFVGRDVTPSRFEQKSHYFFLNRRSISTSF